MPTPDPELLLRLVRASEAFTDHLIMFHLPDPARYSALIEVLDECVLAWSSLDLVPKIAVNALIDVLPVLIGEAVHLEGGLQRQVLDMAIELGDAIRSVFPLLRVGRGERFH